MRLWSIHPKYLDPPGLVALWRETLLAKAVLRNETRGYKNHPQLIRFKDNPAPVSSLNSYLSDIYAEALARGYNFDASKIGPIYKASSIVVTTGQVQHEWQHLLKKLQQRSPTLYEKYCTVKKPALHPLFSEIKGPIAAWEKP